jgi:hypothetical protein
VDGSQLTVFGSTVSNAGTIALNATGDPTKLIISGSVSLQGGGDTLLSDNSSNAIVSNGTSTELINVDNTISGAGTIGDANLELINAAGGVIDATGTNALIIATGSQPLENSGTLEATGTGGLMIDGIIGNSNSASVIEAIGTGSHVDLNNNAVVTFGMLTTASGGLIDTNGNVTLNSVGLAGNLVVNDGSVLTLAGMGSNTGTITLQSMGSATKLVINNNGGAWTNQGMITLTDNSHNAIDGFTLGNELENLGTISGAGTIGDANLELINAAGGVIDATGTNALIIAAGSFSTVNAGLIEASAGSTLRIMGDILNEGGSLALAAKAELDLAAPTLKRLCTAAPTPRSSWITRRP